MRVLLDEGHTARTDLFLLRARPAASAKLDSTAHALVDNLLNPSGTGNRSVPIHIQGYGVKALSVVSSVISLG